VTNKLANPKTCIWYKNLVHSQVTAS